MIRIFLRRWSWALAMIAAVSITVSCLLILQSLNRSIATEYESSLQSLHCASSLNELATQMVAAAASQRGLLLTQRPLYAQAYRHAIARVQVLTGEITAYYLHRNDEVTLVRFNRLTEMLGQHIAIMEIPLATSTTPTLATSTMLSTDQGQLAMNRWISEIAALHQLEDDRAQAGADAGRRDHRVSSYSVFAISALNTLMLVLIFTNLGRQLRMGREVQHELIHEQEVLDQLVRERTEQLEELADHLQTISENEKTELARELHDDLGSILTGIKMDLAWVHTKMANVDTVLDGKINRILTNLGQSIQVTRRLIESMRPTVLTNFGLITALRMLATESAQQNGWELELDMPDEEHPLPESISIALYRIVQESLNNAAKYARASKLRLGLMVDSDIVKLEIEDDGLGMSIEQIQRPKRHGVLGMRQRVLARGGKFDIRSAPHCGTQIQVLMPAPTKEMVRQADEEAATEEISIPALLPVSSLIKNMRKRLLGAARSRIVLTPHRRKTDEGISDNR